MMKIFWDMVKEEKDVKYQLILNGILLVLILIGLSNVTKFHPLSFTVWAFALGFSIGVLFMRYLKRSAIVKAEEAHAELWRRMEEPREPSQALKDLMSRKTHWDEHWKK